MCCRSEHSSCPSLPTKHTKLPSVPQLPKFILSVSCSLCLEVSLPRSLGDWFLLIFQISQLKHHPLRQASLTTLSKIAPALAYHSLSHHLVLGGCSLLQMCGYTSMMKCNLHFTVWWHDVCTPAVTANVTLHFLRGCTLTSQGVNVFLALLST